MRRAADLYFGQARDVKIVDDTEATDKALKSAQSAYGAIAQDGQTVIYQIIGYEGLAKVAQEMGEFEQAIFVSMKAVEVRVRELSGLGPDLVGVDLMNQAFGAKGVLADPQAVAGEREGRRALFAGAYAVLRNPAGHRDVNYDDVAQAAEAVSTASLLMRMLDATAGERATG